MFLFILLTFEGERDGDRKANLQVVVLNDVSVFVESNVSEWGVAWSVVGPVWALLDICTIGMQKKKLRW
jgi:hypothetical protein